MKRKSMGREMREVEIEKEEEEMKGVDVDRVIVKNFFFLGQKFE